MKTDFYIKFKSRKAYGGLSLAGAPKTSIKKMTVAPDEVCVKMSIEIPDAMFEKPIITITGKIGMEIPKDQELVIANAAKLMLENKLNLVVEINR